MEHIGVLRPLRVGTHAVENCTQSELVHVIFAHGSTRPLEIQFAVVPEPPPEPEPEPETREQQLAHLSKRQLRQRAEKAGVAPGKLKKAQSGSTPKADLIRLVLTAEPEPVRLRPTACCLSRQSPRTGTISECSVVWCVQEPEPSPRVVPPPSPSHSMTSASSASSALSEQNASLREENATLRSELASVQA